MSIPLDNLYHYIESQCSSAITLYLFAPHGSKKISDLQVLRGYSESLTHLAPRLICHDQEPLCYQNYTDESKDMQALRNKIDQHFFNDIGLSKFLHLENLNLSTATLYQGLSIFDKFVLLHSEKNSQDLDLYQTNGYEGAYYWCHAVLARDWFRFAEYDTRLDVRNPTNTFLIHSRGFTNSREYRLKFIEQLIKHGLLSDCHVSMLKQEEGITVFDYQFKNCDFEIEDRTVFDHVAPCEHLSSASADYSVDEYEKTLCSVVLETEFDGSRIHLTEKICRPMACGHPFILAAGPGSLELLRSYGFKTFSPWIDESYDQEYNSTQRIYKILDAMTKIKNLSKQDLRAWFNAVQNIANYNRQHFFSAAFFNQVCTELKTNLNNAIEAVYQTQGSNWLRNRQKIRQQKLPNYLAQLKRHNETVKLKELHRLRSARINQQSL